MQTLLRDLRYGARMLAKQPGITFLALLALALGIGVNTAILSTVNAFIIRPLASPHPEELARPFMGGTADPEVWGNFSYPNYLDLRDQNRVFSGLLASQTWYVGISDNANRGSGEAEKIWGEVVSGNYFDVLGIRMALGRGFLPEEDRTPGTHPVVVLGYTLWQQRFHADPSFIGKTTYLNGRPFTVIGVAPPEFQGMDSAIRSSFWFPMMMQTQLGVSQGWITDRSWRNLKLLGRLKIGVRMKQAEADLNLIGENLGKLYPATNAGTKIQVVPEVDGRWGDYSGFLKLSSKIALVVAGLVLLAACANIANLLLVRAGARSREIGIRLAIGAGRLRIVQQLLMESLLLAFMGGVLGILFAFWATDLIQASIPPLKIPHKLNFSPDLLVLKWTMLVALLTGVIFGLAPALIAARTDLVAVLKSDAKREGQVHGSRGKARWWNLRKLLVIAQVAISVIVLVCAGLFLNSLNRAQNADPGYSAENLITMRLTPGVAGYGMAEGKRFFSELLRRLETQPGVRAASLSLNLPLDPDYRSLGPIVREGEPLPTPDQRQYIEFNVIARGYFETMRTQLVLGRDFTQLDKEDAPKVAIVNQAFARRFYGSEQNAIGKRFWQYGPGTELLEIVGIARDGRYISLYENPRPYFFLPENQGGFQSEMTLLVSAAVSADLKAVAEGMRREIAQIDSRVPAYGLLIGEQNLAYAYWGPRLSAGLGTGFGLLVLVLATMGLYSVMAYAVSRHTREIGIRVALGAQGRDILKMVIRQGLILVAAGMALGLAGALALTRILSSLLYGVSARDPLTFVEVVGLLVVVALLACWIPARRAAKVDPMIALRCE
jgi:putative ABC transport system permease protein